MEIFEFKKSLPVRLEEFMSVLSWSNKLIPASQVHDEWSYFIQLQIEPGGWQAMWKIPRAICEDLKIPYPNIVLGIVEHVICNDLKAIFTIQAVEKENIHLPETQEVKLEDLYVTKLQENTALNMEKTAEIIDNLRFFYKNVWMPWDHDDDDDLDWVKKHLESRMQFYYELQKKIINCSVANHIRNLLREARYIQDKRQYLEMDLSDDEELEESVNKTNVPDLLQLHLRLKLIKNEMDILENPHMRKIYEEFKLTEHCKIEKDIENSYIFMVMKPYTLEDLRTVLETSEKFVNGSTLVRICPTLQEALQICQSNDQILLDSGSHTVKFVKYLHDKGFISGLYQPNDLNKTIINSTDNDRVLFVIDGDFTLRNLTLDCKNTRTGIVIKSGSIKIIDCHIFGDKDSSTKQGIYVSGNASLIIEGTRLEDFAVGLTLIEESSATLRNSSMQGCDKAIEVNSKTKIICENTKISNSKTAGIVFESQNIELKEKRIVLTDFDGISNIKMPWTGNCVFEENSCNIVIYNREIKLYEQIIGCDSSNDSFALNIDDQNDENFFNPMQIKDSEISLCKVDNDNSK